MLSFLFYYLKIVFIFLDTIMELKKEHFFDWDHLLTRNVVQAIVANPNQWEMIMNFIWKIMKDDEEFYMEKKWLKLKYDHDMKELCEKYGRDLDYNE